MAAHLAGIHSAIKMLNSRIRILHSYLLAMQNGIFNFLLFVKMFMMKKLGIKSRAVIPFLFISYGRALISGLSSELSCYISGF